MPPPRGRGGLTLFGIARRVESSNPAVERPMVPPAVPGRCERLAGAVVSASRALLRAVGPVAEGLVTAEEQLLDIPEDVQLLRLHLGFEDLHHVLREAKAGPQLNEDFANGLGVVRDPEGRPEDFLDEVEVLGRDLHVERLERRVLRERSPSHGLQVDSI